MSRVLTRRWRGSVKISRARVVMGLSPLWALIAMVGVVLVFLLIIGKDPITVFGALLHGAAGTWYNFGTTLVRTTPLIFSGLAVSFAYRCGVFNLGVQGQLEMGALALAAGIIAGSLWGGIPGLLRAKLGISEIVVTIMLNYVAMYTVYLFVQGPMKGTNVSYPTTNAFPKDVWMPVVLPGTRVHLGFVLALLAAVLFYVVFRRTTVGFEIRAVGFNPIASRFSGMNVPKNVVLVMLISGALGGLLGASEVMGVNHRLAEFWSLGWGLEGVAVALLGRANPLGVVLAAFLFGAMRAGASNMQAMTSLPAALIYIMQGTPVIVLIALTGPGFIRDFMVGRRRKVA
jgi:ABC-type uncharacterized transport system permease subunit